MFMNIFLCSSVFIVVSANNVIPVQTYHIYQQNGFENPPVSQPINIRPYNPTLTVQNQLQQLNISPTSIKQALLNKLLTGSSAQINLSPYTQNYDSNLGNAQIYQIPMNFVNDRVVVPTDYYKGVTSNYYDIPLSNPVGREQLNQNKKKKIKSKRSQKSDEKFEDNSHNLEINQRTKNMDTVNEKNKNKKKNNRKESDRYTDASKTEKNRSNSTRTTNQKNKDKEKITEGPENINKERKAKLRHRHKHKKINEQDAKNNKPESQISNQSKYRDLNDNLDLDITYEGMDNENRKTRNSKHELNKISKSVPNVFQYNPNHYLSNLNQLSNPLMSNWFANYENLYKSLLADQTTVISESKPRRRKNNKKNRKNKKRKNMQNNNSTSETSNINMNMLQAEFTTEDPHSDPIVESFKPYDTDEKSLKYHSNEIFQDTYNLNEFDDVYDTGYYESYIDDYYPLFTDNAAYTANNKEIVVKNLNDTKYFYAPDEIETDIPKIHEESSYVSFEEIPIDYEINKQTYNEIEKESIRNAYENQNEETHFRSPPFLESPDFETRQVDKSEIKPEIYFMSGDNRNRYVGDKSFSAKTANFCGPKKIKSESNDIETVYAKTKVVAYGPRYFPEDVPNTSPGVDLWTDHSFTSNSYQSGGTTYVVAKSLVDNVEYK